MKIFREFSAIYQNCGFSSHLSLDFRRFSPFFASLCPFLPFHAPSIAFQKKGEFHRISTAQTNGAPPASRCSGPVLKQRPTAHPAGS
ncbi:MAG TPA: hypothetical protein H9694_11005 [Firmicutes bacterium]|nr:hypothetical protein [Bacillota bacterium]